MTVDNPIDITSQEDSNGPMPENGSQGRGSQVGRFLMDVLETLVLSLLLFAGINFVTERIRVDGSSMLPNFDSGELVIVNKLAYRLGEPLRGDVVVFHYPYDPDKEYIKRIIGLPGEKVRVFGGEVFIDEVKLDEAYIAEAPRYSIEVTVPENSLFVMGDNRNNSSDSHSWGALPMDYVIGKAIVVYWPPASWGLVQHFSSVAP